MEELPTLESLTEQAESLGLPPDGLTFAVGEDGLNFAYIIVDSLQVQDPLLADSVPMPVENLNLPENDEKFIPSKTLEQIVGKTTEAGILVTTSNNTPFSTIVTSLGGIPTVTPNTTTTATLQPQVSAVVQSRPIQISLLQDGGVFMHEDQKCDIESLFIDHQDVPATDLEIKYDQTLINSLEGDSLTAYSTFDENSEQENGAASFVTVSKAENSFSSVSAEPVIIFTTVDTKPECTVTTTATASQVVSNNTVVNHTASDTAAPPVRKPVRTYGKPKVQGKDSVPLPPPLTAPVVEEKPPPPPSVPVPPPPSKPPPSIQPLFTIPPSPDAKKATQVLRVTEVHITQPQRITIPIPIKKRRIIIDSQKQVPISEFKRQLTNTKDIVHARSELAPSTRKAMKCLELGGVAQFFSSPGRPIRNTLLSRLFTNHLLVVTNTKNESSELTDVTPLNPDLRFPDSSKPEDDAGLVNVSNEDSTSRPKKRLTPMGKAADLGKSLFKGLRVRKPPVFKEYKSIEQIKKATETKKTSKFKHKPKSNHKTANASQEVVYRVEGGELFVLKPDGDTTALSLGSTQDDEVNVNTELTLNASMEADKVIKEEREERSEPSCDENVLISGDLDEPKIEPKIETDTEFESTNCLISTELCNNSNSNCHVTSSNKSIDPLSDNDPKLWTCEVSSS